MMITNNFHHMIMFYLIMWITAFWLNNGIETVIFTFLYMTTRQLNAGDSSEDVQNLSELVMPQLDSPEAPPKPEEGPKAGQKYWLSKEARQRKAAYMKTYLARKKEELNNKLEFLEAHHINPRLLTMENINGKVIRRRLESEAQ